MRIEQLANLEAAIRLGSLRRAADEAGIASPSLSDQIRRLEEELGVILLLRTRRGVRGTDAAERLLPHIRTMLRLEATIREEAAAMSEIRAGRIRVGVVSSASGSAYMAAIRSFSEEHPRIHFTAVEHGSGQICDLVLSGDLDLGIVLRLAETPPPPGLRAESIVGGRLCVCVPVGHPFARRASLVADDLAGTQMIVYQQGFLLRAVFEELRRDRDIRIVYITDNHSTLQRMVAERVGIALSSGTDARQVELSGAVRLVPLEGDWALTTISMVLRVDEHPTPATNAFVRQLRRAAARAPRASAQG